MLPYGIWDKYHYSILADPVPKYERIRDIVLLSVCLLTLKMEDQVKHLTEKGISVAYVGFYIQ